MQDNNNQEQELDMNHLMQIRREKLEELQKQLKGRVEKDIPKKIIVFWEWKYENGMEENGQDTNDGKKLENYYFDIVVEPM